MERVETIDQFMDNLLEHCKKIPLLKHFGCGLCTVKLLNLDPPPQKQNKTHYPTEGRVQVKAGRQKRRSFFLFSGGFYF